MALAGLAVLAAALLALPAPAQAQTEVPADWALKPANIGAGEQFRLMFVTSTERNATSTTIADYNTFVRDRAAVGLNAIRTYSDDFTALVSTESVNARANTLTRATDTDVPIYWARSAGVRALERAADDYADFYDGSWPTATRGYFESGAFVGIGSLPNAFWTGTNTDGTTHATMFMGATGSVIAWRGLSTGNLTSSFQSTTTKRIVALSPVFQVAGGTTNTAPTGADKTVTTGEDMTYIFTAADFGYDDADDDVLDSVKIETLPGAGALALDGAAMEAGDAATKTRIDANQLTFRPALNAHADAYTTFTFKVNDGMADSDSAYTITIDVTDAPAPGACNAPDFVDLNRRPIWTGMVTAGESTGFGITYYGYYKPGHDSLVLAGVGELDDPTFSIGSNNYEVAGVNVDSTDVIGRLFFEVPSGESLTAGEVPALRLHVCDTDSYDFSEASNHQNQNSYFWDDTGLDWSPPVVTRTLYLSLPANNLAEGDPTISGTATVGQVLTAHTSAITDEDGLTGVEFAYQWLRLDADGTNEMEIPGATAATYTLIAADAGRKVKVRVSFTDELSGEEERTSAAYPAGAATIQAPPAGACVAPGFPGGATRIWTGAVTVGEFDAGGNGVFRGYSTGTLSAVPQSFGILVDDDFIIDGTTYTVENLLVNPTLGIKQFFDLDRTLPSAEIDKFTLYFCDTPLALASVTGNTSGHVYRWQDTSIDWTGHASRTVYLQRDAAAPTLVSASVVGTSLVLTFSEALAAAPSLAGDAFTVMRTPAGGTEETVTVTGTPAISGNTVTLTLATAVAATDAVTVSYAKPSTGTGNKLADGSGNEVDSFIPQVVGSGGTATNNPATGTVVINGTAQVGQNLSVFHVLSDADGLTTATYAYQWIRVDGTDAEDIPGANATGYTLTDADLGKKIRVRVSFTDDLGNPESITSEATDTVIAATPPMVSGLAIFSAGTYVSVSFDEILDPNAANVPVSAFSVTADGETVTIDRLAYGADFVGLFFPAGEVVRQGQTVVVTYTDPTAGDDAVAIQDLDGNDVATFTSGEGGVPAVANHSTVPPNSAPVFADATPDRDFAENTAAGQNVGAAVAATDVDTADTLTYTLGGTDAASFDIVGTSGQIRTITGVSYDHEAKDSYTVMVTVSDGTATAVATVTIAVTDVDEPPDAPATPVVSAVSGSTTSVTVTWAAPANAGRPAIESYDLQYRAGDSGSWSDGPQNVTGTSATITGLTMDTAYQAQVRATNDEGDSGWSEPPGSGRTNAATNNAPVFDPAMPDRELAENTAAGVDVGDPVAATDEDGDALTYTLGGTDAASFDIVGTSGQIRTIAGVSYDHEAKDSYSVTVTASDGTATADAGVTIAVTDVNEPPDAPATPVVSAVSGSTTSVSVSWTAPANAGRPDIENYDLQYRAGDSGPWSDGPQNVTGTSETITGLAMDTAYQVQVRATNDEGDSGWSEPPGEGRTDAAAVSTPDAPGNFDTTAGDGRVTLSWTAPAGDGGAAILNYEYRVRPADDSAAWNPDWTDVPDGSDPGSSAADETRFVVSGLSNGTQYAFELRAENSAGEGAVVSANETPLAAPPDEPGRPRGLQADAGDGQVTLRWEAPLDDGGSSITEYQYRHGEGASVPAGATWHSAGLNSRQTVTGLTNGRQYSFEVRAANSAGEGPPASIQARPEAIATAPSAPRSLKAVTSNGQVRLSWFAPERDGGSSITEYQYRHAAGRSVPDDTPWGSVERRRLQVGIGSLRNGQLYTFQVRAVAAAAGPVASVTATPVASPVRQPPGAVTGLSATAEATVDERTRKQSARVTLQWRPPAADDNSVLERFEYRWAESGSALPDRWVHGSADSTSETIERLKRGTRYVFEGRAVNLEGPGPAARTAVATPAAEAGMSLYARQPTAVEGEVFTFEVRRPGHLDLGPEEAFVLVGVTDSAFPHIPALGGPVGGNGAGGRVVKFQSGARSASGTITVEFDGERPASRSLTITLQAVNSPYIYGSPLRLDIPVSDRDAGLSVRDASVREGPGARLEFRVTLDRRRDREVTVSYATADGTATQGEDYTRTRGTLAFAAGETSKTVSVPVLDDAHNEASETLTLTLSNARGAVIDDATAVGTIVNSDSIPDAWLSRFGRAVSDQVVQSIGRRLEGGARESHLTVMGLRVDSRFGSSHSARDGCEPDGSLRAPDGRIGPPGAMAGGAGGVGAMPAPGAAPAALDGAVTQGFAPMQGAAPADDNRWLDLVGRLFMTLGPNGAHRPGLRDLVMGSSFHYGHSPDGGAFRGMSRVAAWGESASTRFSGTEGRLALDGEVDTVIVGVDGEGDRWMGGLALSYSEGGGAYRHASASGGAVSSTLGGINPYARYELNERTSIWGTLGYGSGRLTLTPEAAAAAIETDVTNRMAAFGGRGVLSVRGGESGRFELALRSDAMFTDTASPAVPGLSGGEGATSRIRLIVEGSGSAAALGGTLTPRVEAGLRYDGGDAETGAGLEVGGGLAYDIARLTVQVDGRVLLTHRDRDYEESGYSVSVLYKPGGNGRGLQLEGGSQWGATQSGVQSLWSLKNAGGLRSGVPARNAQAYTGELGYGFGARRLWYPYVATESGGASSRSLRFGLKLSAGPGLEAGLEIGRRADGFGRTENDIRLRWSARW